MATHTSSSSRQHVFERARRNGDVGDDALWEVEDLRSHGQQATQFATDASQDWHEASRKAGLASWQNGGYFQEQPTSVFVAKGIRPDELQPPAMASVDEFAMCLVNVFPDVEVAFQYFDCSKSGQLTLTGFEVGARNLGFSSKDSKKVFKAMDSLDENGQRDFSISRKEFAWLWKLGGGTIEPDLSLKRYAEVSSVTQILASAAGPPLVHSFGDFLEGSTRTPEIFSNRDVEDPILVFARWAAGRWDVLHSLFTPQEKAGMHSGRRKVRAEEFANFVRALGFEGNIVRVFSEIKEHGPPRTLRSKAAKLAAGVDDDEDALMEETDEISTSQLQRFQKRVGVMLSNLKGGQQGSPAHRLIKLLQEKRGSIFRAWRLDLDIREIGNISFNDLTVVCRKLEIPTETRQIWNSFRPDGSTRPLQLADFDAKEASTIDQFIMCLWSNFGFDLDKAWAAIDANGRKMVSMDEWLQGMRCIGFEGDGKTIFRGLSLLGLGRLRRNELSYIDVLSRAAPWMQYSAPLVKEFCTWVQSRFNSPEEFLDKVGLTKLRNKSGQPAKQAEQAYEESQKKLGVADFAARLTAMGYPSDALQVAIVAAKAGGKRETLEREKLLELLVGKRKGAPPPKGSLNRLSRSASQPKKTNQTGFSWRPKKAWTDNLHIVTVSNEGMSAGVRTYFSVPDKTSGVSGDQTRLLNESAASKSTARSVSPKARSVSPRIDTRWSERSSQLARTRSVTPPRLDFDESGFSTSITEKGSRFVWGGDDPSLKALEQQRPAFDNRLNFTCEQNLKVSNHVRKYFSETSKRPVKDDIIRRITERTTPRSQRTTPRSQRAA